MLAAYPSIQASDYMIKHDDLLLPGIYDPEVLLLLKDIAEEDYPVGWSGLMFAVIDQARIDAAQGDQTAAEWLASDQCFDYCYALGFEHENILAWLKCRKFTN